MKRSINRVMRSIEMGAVSLLIVSSVTAQNAVNATWSGASNGVWVNPANWSGNNWPNGDVKATFNSAGGGNTQVDLSYSGSLEPAIKQIGFDSAACAAYTLGLNGTQRLWLRSGGSITVGSAVTTDQTIGGYVLLGHGTAAHTVTLQNESDNATLRFLNGLRFWDNATGSATIHVRGVGDVRFDGTTITNGMAQCHLYNYNSVGSVIFGGNSHITRVISSYRLEPSIETRMQLLSGAELFLDYGSESYSIWHEGNGVIDGAGTLRFGVADNGDPAKIYIKTDGMLTIKTPIASAGGLETYSTASGGGTLVLDCVNLMAGDLINNSIGMFSVAKIGNQGSLDSNVGQGTTIQFNGGASGMGLIYTGVGETSNRKIEFKRGIVLDQAGSGDLILSSDFVVGANNKVLTLRGSTAAAGVIGGSIGPGSSGTLSLLKEGSGEWRLEGSNSYTGATTVDAGLLAVAGASGYIGASAGIVINAGTFKIANSVSANLGDRIAQSVPINLNGGRLAFSHTGGAQDYSETLGDVVVGDGASTIETAQADEGQSSTLIITALSRTGSGSVNFVGMGLGAQGSTRNRVLFDTPPVLDENGYIGVWVTINGLAIARYDAVRGIYSDSVEIAARGPNSVIPDNSSAGVNIVTVGVSGPILLAEENTTISALTQSSSTPAVVALNGGTLGASYLRIIEGAASLTIGESQGDGILQSVTGALFVDNNSENPLIINSSVVEADVG